MPFSIILTTFNTPPCFVSLYFQIFKCIDSRRDCTSFHEKKGLKAQRFVTEKR
jgi:hypothetical protein